MKKPRRANQRRTIAGHPVLKRNYLGAGIGIAFSLIPGAASANTPEHTGNFGGGPLAVIPHSPGSTGTGLAWHSFAVHNAGAANLLLKTTSSPPVSGSPGTINLGSGQLQYTLSGLSNIQTLTIDVGGKSETIGAGTKLTGAELLAADQVLSSGHQTLTINGSGAATGGAFTLSSQSLSKLDEAIGSLSGLAIPHNVRIVDAVSNLQLSGDLTNSGHLSVQTGTGGGAIIEAADITNNTGGLISTTGQGGHGGTLTLIAGDSLINGGTISAGNLSICTPSVTNAGTIKATSGNVNLSSSQSININNSSGTVSALAGNINVNTAPGNGNIGLSGGNFLSQELNAGTGTGDVNINAGNITGIVNVNACNAHINASTPDLQLGKMNVTGDPTYFNQGNITITNAMAPTDGQPLAIVASGNILSNGGSLDTSFQGLIGSGGNLLLIAGANFTTNPVLSSGNNDTTTTLTLTPGPGSGGGSTTGGLIDLSGGHGGKAPISLISTAGGGIGNAGTITMLAFAGKGSGTGSVTLPQTFTLNSGTNGFGTAGAITIEAGATKGTAISVGNIDSSTGRSGPGEVFLAASQPGITNPTTILSGAITGGGLTGMLLPTSASISTGNITTGGGEVEITTNGSFGFNNINTAGAQGLAVTTAAGTAGGAGGDVLITSAGGVKGSNIYAFGGGGGGGSIDATNNGTDGGSGGQGGIVQISAGAGAVTLSGMINVSGGGGGGGAGASYTGTAGAPGAGGAGGSSGAATISTLTNITVSGGIFAVDGAKGGDGSMVSAANNAGGGGGGGGSYGGGGGGGASGNDQSTGALGGGGGGGLYGGGGGSGVAAGGTSNLGGNGGGFNGPGSGGVGGTPAITVDTGSSGTRLSGGNGAGASLVTLSGLGGGQGFGGLGGQAVGGNGFNGESVITATANGNVVTGGTVTLNMDFGTIGTSKAPLNILSPDLILAAKFLTKLPNETVVINDGAGLSANIEVLGTLNLTASGSIDTFGAQTLCETLNLTTAPGSNGNINLGTGLVATTANLNASGAGTITAMSGLQNIVTNLNLTSGSGQIGTSANPITVNNINCTATANSAGSIYVGGEFDLTLGKSSSSQNSLFATAGMTLTVTGPVSTPMGLAALQAGSELLLENNVSAGPGGAVVLTATGSGNILEKKVSINTPLIELGIDAGTVGTAKNPFLTNATTVDINGNATDVNTTSIYINDTNTAPTTVANLGNPGRRIVTTSDSSALSFKSTGFGAFNVTNTNKTGSIFFSGNCGNDGESSITTVGGNVTQQAGTVLNADVLTCKTTSGNFGTAGTPLNFVAHQLSITTGKTGTAAFASTGGIKLLSSTGGTIDLQDLETTLAGAIKVASLSVQDMGPGATTVQATAPITASSVLISSQTGNITVDAPIKAAGVTLDSVAGNLGYNSAIGLGTGGVSLTAAGSVLQTAATAVISGATVSIASGSTGQANQPLTVIAPSLTLNSMGSIFCSVAGTTTLQNAGALGGAVSLSATGNIVLASSAAFVSTGNMAITAKSFSELSGASIGSSGTLNITATAAKDSIDLEGSVAVGLNGMSLITPSVGEVTVGATATVFSPGLLIQTATLENSGKIETTLTPATPAGTLTISNPAGNLQINNITGGTITNPLTLALTSAGNLTIVDPAGGFQTLQSQNANSIQLTAGGVLTIPTLTANALLAAPDAMGNGGTITISAASVVYPNAHLDLYASALTNSMGNGGQVFLTITGKQNILANTNLWIFSANSGINGGNGGNVTVSTGGSIFVNQAGGSIANGCLNNSGNGGNVSLTAAGNVAIEGNLDMSSIGGSAGNVTVVANGKTPFIIDQGAITSVAGNGAAGITGGMVSITNPAGVNVNNNANNMITASTSLTITSSEFSVLGSGSLQSTTANSITVQNPTGNLTINGTGSWNFSNPILILQLTSGGNLNTGSVFSLLPVIPTVDILSAKDTLTLGTTSLFVGQFMNVGGRISITASSLAYSIATPSPLLLDATGNNSLVGGTVDLTLTGKNPVTLSSAGAGNIQIITAPTNAGATAGGIVDVVTGGTLTVNDSGLQPTVNQLPAAVTLQSSSALLVTGWNANIIGMGGSLTASGNTSKTFIVGTPVTSGINTGGGQIQGANISITNNGGDVMIGGADFLNATSQVTVTGKDILGPGANEAIFAPSVVLTANGGSIGQQSSALILNGPSAISLTANAGSKGNVFIDENAGFSVTLGASSAKDFNLQTEDTLIVSGQLNASQVTLTPLNNNDIIITNSIGNGTGNVNLNTTGTGAVIQGAGTINAIALSLGGSTASGLQTNVSQVSGNLSGSILIDNIGTKLLTIGSAGLQAGSGDITLTTAGALTEAGPVFAFSNVTYNAGGTITIDGKLQGSTGTTSLNASHGGLVTEGKSGAISSPNLTMTSDSGNITNGKGTINASYLVLGTSGNINLTDSLSNGNIVVAPIAAPVASFTLTASTDAASTLFLNNIATQNGSINVVFSGGNLLLPTSTQLTTNNGNITLQNTLASTGMLTIGANSFIHASATAAGLGNVNLFVGPAPKKPTVGTTPSNIVPGFQGKGQIFYNNANAISAANPVFLNANGRDIEISGVNANTIILNNNATITADPPATAPTSTGGAPVAITQTAAAQPELSSSMVLPAKTDSGLYLAPQWQIQSSPLVAINANAISQNTLQPLIENMTVTDCATFSATCQSPTQATTAANQETALFPSQSQGIDGAAFSSPAKETTDKRANKVGDQRQSEKPSVRKYIGEEALLIAANTDTVVESKLAAVQLKHGSLALIVSTSRGLSVFNFDDKQKDSVVVQLKGTRVSLGPGQHLTIGVGGISDYSAINPAQMIAHRRMNCQMVNGQPTYKSEFHILSAIASVKSLGDLVNSKDPQKSKAARHLLKTAAILDGLSQYGAEPFELYSKNQALAMNQ